MCSMFISGVQESVLVDFVSQNKVKILHIVKTVKIILIKNFHTKMNKLLLSFLKFFFNFWAAIKILFAVLFDFKLLK